MNLIPRVSGGGGATCFLWTCVLTIHLGKTKTGNSQHPTSRQTDHHRDPLDPPLSWWTTCSHGLGTVTTGGLGLTTLTLTTIVWA